MFQAFFDLRRINGRLDETIRIIGVRQCRRILGEIDIFVPAGDVITLETVFLTIAANLAEQAIGEDIVADRGQPADGHTETAEAIAEVFPGIGFGIVTSDHMRRIAVFESVVETAAFFTAKGARDINFSILGLFMA